MQWAMRVLIGIRVDMVVDMCVHPSNARSCPTKSPEQAEQVFQRFAHPETVMAEEPMERHGYPEASGQEVDTERTQPVPPGNVQEQTHEDRDQSNHLCEEDTKSVRSGKIPKRIHENI